MDGNTSGGDVDNCGWTTEDELEIDNFTFSPDMNPGPLPTEGSSTAGCSGTKLIDKLLKMGFPLNVAAATIKEIGEENEELIIDTLLKPSPKIPSVACSSNSKMVGDFVEMGFPEEIIYKAIQENDESDSDSILETILAYLALEDVPHDGKVHIKEETDDDLDPELTGSYFDECSDMSSCSENEKP